VLILGRTNRYLHSAIPFILSFMPPIGLEYWNEKNGDLQFFAIFARELPCATASAGHSKVLDYIKKLYHTLRI
jgi:hypothetical protein